MIKFIILTTQRSGSTFLWQYLNSHPDICGYGEVFNNSIVRNNSYAFYLQSSIGRKLMRKASLNISVNQYLDYLFSSSKDHEALGFKLMYNHLKAYPIINDWLVKNNVHIIHLIRKNVLKTIISKKTAAKRGQYHLSQGKVEDVKIELQTDDLLKKIQVFTDQFEEHRNRYSIFPYIEVGYEDLFSNIDKEKVRILEFLGVDADKDLSCELKKINTDSLQEIIANYQEVEQVLKDTPYYSFLQLDS